MNDQIQDVRSGNARSMGQWALLALVPAFLLQLGCRGSNSGAEVQVPEPIEVHGSAYEAALAVPLPSAEPEEVAGLHHVFQLSEQIISGAEPTGRASMEQLVAWGVRTVVSVDGEVPDVATAEELGLRYVHIPIQYADITEDELFKLAKTFRELEAPFYVHCYHGKHRGPAAAAVGRLVLDGCERDRAIAEMRQWGTTSGKYEGLYSTIAASEMPTAEETRAFEYDFDPAQSFDGLRAAMVGLTRTWDHLQWLEECDWKAPEEHPDLKANREAEQLLRLFEATAADSEAPTWTGEFHGLLEGGTLAAKQLAAALDSGERDSAVLAEAMEAIRVSCRDCHREFRNRR